MLKMWCTMTITFNFHGHTIIVLMGILQDLCTVVLPRTDLFLCAHFPISVLVPPNPITRNQIQLFLSCRNPSQRKIWASVEIRVDNKTWKLSLDILLALKNFKLGLFLWNSYVDVAMY
jgi:hypothetical protein